MTLHRSHLLPASLADIAISANARQGQYGAITGIADEHGLSRQSVYRIRDHAQQALVEGFQPQQPQRWAPEVPEEDLKRGIVAMYTIAPCSIDDIVDIIPVIWPKNRRSHGYIHSVIKTAKQNAALFLEDIDLANIDAVAIDEMFWHKTPLLTGIDLDSGFLFSAEKTLDRSGPEWVSRLTTLKGNGLDPAVIIKDAGSAMAEAATQVFPNAEQRDDLFHAIALLNETGRYLENAAYRAIKTFEALDKKRRRAKKNRRALGQKCRHYRPRMDAAIERFDTFDGLSESVKVLLRLCDPGSGELRRAEEIRERLPQLAEEIASLGGKRARKVGRYLRGRVEGLCGYLSSVSSELASCEQLLGDARLVGCVIRSYQANLLSGRGVRWQRAERQAELEGAIRELVEVSGRPARLCRAVAVVVPVLERRHRASSAIENVHSVLRPYIGVHKRVSQGFLDLFRFYWNTRKRRWGRHKGTSALEVLTGEPHADWLTLLGFPPSDPTR